ncbi:MAG: M20 family metallopeptidase [Promethearchaeota archaeon]
MNFEKIFKEVDELKKQEIMALLKELIGVPTIVPPGDNYQDYVNTISPYFKELGYDLKEVVVPEKFVKEIPYDLKGPRVNLVATKNYGADKDISFYGHMDVVPAPNEGAKKWRFPPFEATIIGSGKIYGRGVADMKGSMVALILALQLIEKLDLTPKYNINVLNCTDEEIGIYPGVRYLAEQNYVKGTIFCMEGIIDPIIFAGCAGALNIIVEAMGRSCHSGMNFMGINSIEEMIPILVELMKLKKIVESRESKDIPGFPRPGTDRQWNMTPMFNLDIIKGGEKPNIVPDLCSLTINRRIIPDEKYEDVKQEILDAIETGKANSKLLDVKTTFIYDYPAVKMNVNSPDVLKLKEIMKIVQDIPEEKIKTVGMSGSTDMGYVSEILNTNDIIFYGVGNAGSNPHGVNETIKLRDLKTYIKELILFLCSDF